MDLLERIQAADAAVRETYGTPAGHSLVIAARFGLTPAAIRPLTEAAMWRAVVADKAAKRRAKLGLDVEDQPQALKLEPTEAAIAAGLTIWRCAPGDMSANCAKLRAAAWDRGWSTWCTRWSGLVPHRSKKGDPWLWSNVRRVSLYLEHADGRRGIGQWEDGAWIDGWLWAPGELRSKIGYNDLVRVVKA